MSVQAESPTKSGVSTVSIASLTGSVNITSLFQSQVKTIKITTTQSQYQIEQQKEQAAFDQSEAALPDILKSIRYCESRDNFQNNDTGHTGHYGAYQFSPSTWDSVGGSGNPAKASPTEQNQRALILFNKQGTVPWAASESCWGNNTPTLSSITIVGQSPYAYNCVAYLRSIGVYVPDGYSYARYLPVTTRKPFVGAVMVSYDSWAGHVSLVTSVNADGTVTVKDGNYIPGDVTIRTVPINSDIKGFF